MSVAPQEELDDHEGGALVTVDERVVAQQAMTIRRGKIREVWLPVGGKVARPGQRGLEQPEIAQPRRAAMLGKLGVVDCENDGLIDPGRFGHFASARSAARRFFMSLRASAI